MKRTSPLFALVVLGFCGWQARDLFKAWRHAPFDRFDPLAFAVWMLPVAVVYSRRAAVCINPTLLLVAAGATLLGSMLDLNALQNLSLAAVLGSFAVADRWTVPWLLAAVAWMPMFGWFVSAAGFAGVAAARLAVAGAAAFWGCRVLLPTGKWRVA